MRSALNHFSAVCSELTGILPDKSFDAWSQDSLLPNGVAINPQAAAQCVHDYQRSVVFIRGVYAAIISLKQHFVDCPIEILYAGCGPFATLLLPILGRFPEGGINISLLDIHQHSLDSAELLFENFSYGRHLANVIRGDACTYQHAGKFHLVIAETMQKSLEQEPQFAVTANLAQQIVPKGVFIPQRIDVSLSLAPLDQEADFFGDHSALSSVVLENRPRRYAIAKVCSLSANNALAQLEAARPCLHTGKLQLESTIVQIPPIEVSAQLLPALFTRIVVYEKFSLEDYECEITLPLRCFELEPLSSGDRYAVNYQLGSYPKFNFELLDNLQGS